MSKLLRPRILPLCVLLLAAAALLVACRPAASPPAPALSPTLQPAASGTAAHRSTPAPEPPAATPTPTGTPTPPATNTPLIMSTLPAAPSPLPGPLPSPTGSPAATPAGAQAPVAADADASAVTTPAPSATNTATPSASAGRSVRIGLNGRNDAAFEEADYRLVRAAGIETLKMMSLTDPAVFARLRQENPGLEFIVRLHDDRIGAAGHPTPAEFAERMVPVMRGLQPYVIKFEVGNEPNHFRRYEGWGPEDADAESFNAWFLEVYELLKTAHPWAELGYPALATPDRYHRDRAWLELNRPAIQRADWLGVHCYWQTLPDGSTTMFDPDRGLCFTYYHDLFPGKPLEITEFDNDNVVWDIPPLSADQIAGEYVTYYRELFKYPYIRSASSFIMSSPDPQWDYFAWRAGEDFRPVVGAVASMERPPLTGF